MGQACLEDLSTGISHYIDGCTSQPKEFVGGLVEVEGVETPQGVRVEDKRKTTEASGLGVMTGSPCAAMFWHKTPHSEILNMNLAFLLCQAMKLEYIFFNHFLA